MTRVQKGEFKESKKSEPRKRKRAAWKGRGRIWIKVADLGLFAGFSSPVMMHLGLLPLPQALAATLLGLALAAPATWAWLKTKETKPEDAEEREGRAWWS